MTFSIMTFSIVYSFGYLYVKCRDYLNVILSAVTLSIVMVSVIRLSVVMLSVMAPFKVITSISVGLLFESQIEPNFINFSVVSKLHA
jgi:hypothetical protein